MMSLLLFQDDEKTGDGTWLTKLTVSKLTVQFVLLALEL